MTEIDQSKVAELRLSAALVALAETRPRESQIKFIRYIEDDEGNRMTFTVQIDRETAEQADWNGLD